MLESLPALKKQLQKIERSQKLNPESKIEKYQKKMLQLLIRQKTTILENEQLQKQLNAAKMKASDTEKVSRETSKKLKQKQQQNDKFRNQIERLSEVVQNLQTQIRMSQMGRLSEEQKYAELLQQYKTLENLKSKIETQLTEAINENNKIKREIAQKNKKSDQQVEQLTETITALNKQLQNNKKSYEKQTNQLKNQLQKNIEILTNKEDQLAKLQQKINVFISSEQNLKQKLNQSLQSNSNLQQKAQQLAKENHLLKIKNKQYESTLYSTEIEKGQQSLEFDKLDKQNKKTKKSLSQLQDKLKQIEEEKSSLEEKYEQLSKNYKNTKKQLEKHKDTLSQVTDCQTGFKSKIDKLELIVKQCRESIQQKDQIIQNLQENLKRTSNDLDAAKTQTIQAKFVAEDMKKKYGVVSQARNLAQQKLVLERQQNAKSLSSMIKQKDLCYRQNYKLLQLLEVKDKTLSKIMNGLKNNEDLQKQLSLQISGRENNTKKVIEEILSKDIKGNKERVKLIDEQLEKYKI